MSSKDILKLIKDKQAEFVDLRFTDPKGKLQHLTMDSTIVDEDMLENGVFFSFFRKVIQNKSPISPDSEHLHMLTFKNVSLIFGKVKGNYINSIVINLVNIILTMPAFIFAKDPVISRYWFFSLIVIYLLIYLRLYRLTKN